jgi:hypothetical protein
MCNKEEEVDDGENKDDSFKNQSETTLIKCTEKGEIVPGRMAQMAIAHFEQELDRQEQERQNA